MKLKTIPPAKKEAQFNKKTKTGTYSDKIHHGEVKRTAKITMDSLIKEKQNLAGKKSISVAKKILANQVNKTPSEIKGDLFDLLKKHSITRTVSMGITDDFTTTISSISEGSWPALIGDLAKYMKKNRIQQKLK